MVTTASRTFELSPEQLKNEITRLEDVVYLDNNHRKLRDVTKGILTARRKDLQTNIAYVQLDESSEHNQEILAGGKGEYNWEDVAKWQKKLGIVNNDKVIPESMFEKLELFKDKSLNYLDLKNSLKTRTSFSWSLEPIISRIECIDNIEVPTSTVLIPRLAAVIGPIVLPHPRSDLIANF